MAIAQRNAARKSTQSRAVCAQCSLDLTEQAGWRPGPVVHCTRPQYAVPQTVRFHHGRRHWSCPKCKNALGCTTCAKTAANAFCERCRIYADGRQYQELTSMERKLMIA